MQFVNQDRALLEQAQPEDWQIVCQLSRQLGVTPLIYQRLDRELTNLKTTTEIQDHLRNSYLSCIGDNVRLYKALEQILRALRDASIPIIPLKGAYLAEKVYLNVGLRPMLDVDLLVKRTDLENAVVVLQELGYQPEYPFDILQEHQNMRHSTTLFKQGTHPVDLHWNLMPPDLKFKIPIEQVWQAAQPGTLAGVEALEMAPEDLLVHLCLHTAYLEYFSSGLRPICDLAWTIDHFQGKLDWNRLVHQAQAWGAERSVFLALQVTQRLLNVTLPDSFLLKNQPGDNDANLVSWAIQQIFAPAEIGGKLAQMWAPQPWLQRGQLIIKSLFPAPREIRKTYPYLAHDLHWVGAYLKHLRIIFQRNRRAAWKLLRRDAAMLAAAKQRNQLNQLISWQREAE